MFRIQLISIIFNLILITSVLTLLRKGSLKEKYSILWLLGFTVLLMLSLSRKILEKAAVFFGVYYAPSFLFLLAFFVTLIMLLHFSIALSTLEKKHKILAQNMALLEEKMKQLSANKKG